MRRSAPRQYKTDGAFSSFNADGYATLWYAGLFSFIAVQMQFLLRGILAWDLTQRESALGLTYLCFGVSMLVATPIGGAVTDRMSKRRLLVITQAVLTTVAIVMGIAVVTGAVRFWMLLIAAVVQGGAFGFYGPARTAISAELVGREHLGNAITLSLLSMNGTRVFAPSLAGVLAGVSTIGIGGTYLISAACSAISFLYLVRLPKTAAQTTVAAPALNGSSNGNGVAPPRPRRQTNPLQEIIGGVRYVFARPPLRRLVISSFFVIMFGFNYVAFYPALVKGEFGLGDQWVGIISSASALGAVAVSIPLAARADSGWARAAMTVGGLAFGLGVVAVGASPSFWVAFGVICFVGGATTVFQSLSNTLALAMTDDSHQGRVQSLMQLSVAGFGIAALPLGGLAEVIGLQPTIMVMGIVATAAVALYAVFEGGWPGLRPRRSEPTDTLDTDVDVAGPVAARA